MRLKRLGVFLAKSTAMLGLAFGVSLLAQGNPTKWSNLLLRATDGALNITVTSSSPDGAAPLQNGANIRLRATDGALNVACTGCGGSMGGSTGATDNALLRADGTGGATVQSSSVIVDDSGNLTLPASAYIKGGTDFRINYSGLVQIRNAADSGYEQLAIENLYANGAVYGKVASMTGATNAWRAAIVDTDVYGYDATRTISLLSTRGIGWVSGTHADAGTADTGIVRDAAGVVQINAGVTGTYGDLKLQMPRVGQTTVPTCSGSCGTSPSVVGSDSAMIVTMGASGSPASPFTVTFNHTWASAPACIAQAAKTGMAAGKAPILSVPSTTTVVITTNGTAPATSDVYSVICVGVQ